MSSSAAISSSESLGEASLADYLNSYRKRIDAELDAWYADGKDQKLIEAVRYSLLLPSKRIRPLFCIEACRAFGGSFEQALPAILALEMVHTYSLVHDDLPAMDNDDLRRGKPTNHKVFGEAFAILAGDGLLTSAFEVLATAGKVAAETRVAWARELSQAAGVNGMVLGQAVDILGINPAKDAAASAVAKAALESLHLRKTGALLAASVVMGAMAAKVSSSVWEPLRSFALDMGLAFQIQDDILDVTGGAEIGKPVKSDERNDKVTYISLLGLDGAKLAAQTSYESALKKLAAIERPQSSRLEELTRYVVERKF